MSKPPQKLPSETELLVSETKALDPEEAPNDNESGIPPMITKRQRQQLYEIGWSDEEVRAITPKEAHHLLTKGGRGPRLS